MSARYEAPMAEQASVDALVLAHAGLVKRLAYYLLGKLPSSVEVDDLIQAGMLGLMSAAAQFSGDKGASFETYAGIRIRGAMLDEARKMSPTPRSALRHARQVAEAARAVEHETGREARPAEIAGKLGLPVEDYFRMLVSAAASRPLSLEQLAEDPERAKTLPQATDPGPDGWLHTAQFRAALADAIRRLGERERLVLSLYYRDELNLKEIGEVLGVSESRVCQIHGQAVLRLRAKLEEWLPA